MTAVRIILFTEIHGGTVLRVVHRTITVLLNTQGDVVGLDATFLFLNTDSQVCLISMRELMRTFDQVEIREQVVVIIVHRQKMPRLPAIVRFVSEATANEKTVLNYQMEITNVIDTSKRNNLLLIVATDFLILATEVIDIKTMMIIMLSRVNQSQENASSGNTKVT